MSFKATVQRREVAAGTLWQFIPSLPFGLLWFIRTPVNKTKDLSRLENCSSQWSKGCLWVPNMKTTIFPVTSGTQRDVPPEPDHFPFHDRMRSAKLLVEMHHTWGWKKEAEQAATDLPLSACEVSNIILTMKFILLAGTIQQARN